MPRMRRIAGLWPAAFAAWCWACDPDSPPDPIDEGFLTVDSEFVIESDFTTAACAEILPAGYRNIDRRDSADAMWVKVTSTACYAAHITVEDTAGTRIRTLDRHFGLPNRRDDDKQRGEIGYLGWDAKDDQGVPAGRGRYLWRIGIDLGGGKTRKYRAEMRL